MKFSLAVLRGLGVGAELGANYRRDERFSQVATTQGATLDGFLQTSGGCAESWGAGWLRVPERGSRPCWNR